MSSTPCAACKLLRRKCTQECVFAPYFPPTEPHKFTFVHRVFGASNVAKILNDLPIHQREHAVNSLYYEAEARLRDPVYGCIGLISVLQHRLKKTQQELTVAKTELGAYTGTAVNNPLFPSPGLPPHNFLTAPPQSSSHPMMAEMGIITPLHGQPLVMGGPRRPRFNPDALIADNTASVTAAGLKQMDIGSVSRLANPYGDAYRHDLEQQVLETQLMLQPPVVLHDQAEAQYLMHPMMLEEQGKRGSEEASN